MEKITCRICGEECHAIQYHLKEKHPEISLVDYKKQYPEAPIYSDAVLERLEELRKKNSESKKGPSAPEPFGGYTVKQFHQVFGIDPSAETKTKTGRDISIKVLDVNKDYEGYIPVVDKNYVFDIENLKNSLMAMELNIPLYIWGHCGTGKTCMVENICGATNRPLVRVQHTVNTEESHVVGQWVVKGGETVFELGPLALAMKHGWVYLADEYDFALPSVLAVYQPVLEGKPLVIKEADAENRIIKPHPNFRFVATGNTNGVGDETGLYQGTSIQNAANYDRFNMVLEVRYMTPEKEIDVLMKQAEIGEEDAKKLVDFAGRIRDEYSGSKLSTPISPRTLIAIARIGFLKGSYRKGIELAFANKLSTIDKDVVNGLSQRIFG